MTKAVIPAAGPRHPVPAGHQGDAQGDAAGRRQAGDPVRRRGGRRRRACTDVLMITGRNKRALEDHFDRNCELEAALEAKGDADRLRPGAARPASSPTSTTSRQGDPRGLGHAVLCAAQHVGDEPFAVLLGDDLIDARDPLLATMLDVQRAARRQRRRADGGAARADPPLRLRRRRGRPTSEDVVTVTDLVEKPAVDEAPSDLAIIGRYVLDPAIFDVLRETAAGPRRRDPAHRRPAQRWPATERARRRCTASSSAAAATTPATGSTTSRPSSGWRASATTWARTSAPGCASYVDRGARTE